MFIRGIVILDRKLQVVEVPLTFWTEIQTSRGISGDTVGCELRKSNFQKYKGMHH